MEHTTRLSFEYDSPERARHIERSLAPEIGDIDDERSQATLQRSGTTLSLSIDAADLVALRAGLNTWLSLVRVAEQADAVGAQEPKA